MADKPHDPTEMWRSFLGEMEKNFSTLASQTPNAEQFRSALNPVGAQKAVTHAMEQYLAGMNLPSRDQLTAVSERLKAIEDQLSEMRALLHDMARANAGISAETSKPARKRPPAAAAKRPE